MGYPSSQPGWQQQELNSLSAQGLLSGVNPLVLSGIGQNESGFEAAGAGINSSGYGGYYGLGQNSTYGFGGKSFTETPALLLSNSQGSFDQQSEAAAAEVASLMASSGGSLQAALAKYTGGGPNNGDYTLVMGDLAGAAPLSGGASTVTGGAGAAPSGGGTAPANATTTAIGGSLNPANWPNELIGAIKPWVARILLIIVALILLKVGMDKLLDTDSSPATIITEAPQSVGAAPSAASKGMQGPGAPQPAQQSAPKPHPVRKGAEHAGEAAAAA